MSHTTITHHISIITLSILMGVAIPSIIVLASSVVGDNISITNTTEQLRLGYNSSIYTSLTTDSAGNLSILSATTSTLPFGIQLVNNRSDGSDLSGSILGGYTGNIIDASSSGSVIAGGGWNGGYENKIINSILGFIGGGHGNIINSTTSSRKQDMVIGGGANNSVVSSDQGMIAGGNNNFIRSAYYSGIASGNRNRIDASSWSTDNSATASFIGGGLYNKIGKSESAILGGAYNELYGDDSVILGGESNISGVPNTGSPDYSVILGGKENVLGTSASYSTIGGRKASSTHAGVFLWADSNNYKFASAATNETAFRSTGGVRFVTAIDGSGNPTKTVSINTSGDIISPGKIVMTASSTPASTTTACTAGTIVWDSSYVYVCVATNSWKRSAISTW
ncbi:MAG: hypothetical protein KBC26_00090 [Candidatus Pacebacteria bacterium]|nr:hypothetical protein [Candidatus Paceibacterota bacterium]